MVWNAHAPELWRRTVIGIRRALDKLARRSGTRVRLSYAKAAEFQRRGLIHFHAIFRLDGIDTVTGMITVDQQVIITDRRPVLAPPKTSASFRDVPMPRFVLDAVIDHAQQLGLGDREVLCRTPRGTLLRRDYYNREIWKPAITAAGLPADATYHDLRHTFASTALAEGVPISEVSRWLGHKSITTTVDLYGHLVPEATGRARDALDTAFGRAQANVPEMCPDGVARDTVPQVSAIDGG